MANQKQNPLAVVGLIVVIVVALFFVIRAAMPRRYRPPDVDWTCEACDYRFIAASAPSPSECPECGEMEAVRSTYYECEECGTVFEAFRRKMPPVVARAEEYEGMPPMMMEGLIKRPGEEWVKEMSEEGMRMMEELSCPNCGNTDPTTLKYSPPTAK